MSHNPLHAQMANGLHWVRDELDRSLDRVRLQIEQRVERPDDGVPLQKALAELHALRGIAVMIRCSGIALLAEEMKQVVVGLMLGKVKDDESACSALLGSTMQLSDYVGMLALGEEDCVLVLQPLINELRLSRHQPILTEPELFSLHLQSLGLLLPMAPPAIPGPQEEARKLLPHFQKSLLSWLKNEPDARMSLGRIGKIGEQLAERSTDVRGHQLWRVVAATAEALLADELDHLAEIKRLIGAVGQQIKLLADHGEAAALDKLGDLSGLLLFHVGRSEARGPRVEQLRKAFPLGALLPDIAVLDERRARLRGPGPVLLHHVADEVRKDFNRAKDSIDLVVRSGRTTPSDLAGISAHLHRIASTLSVLGLTPMQHMLENQRRALEGLPQSADAATLWMNLATTILQVELQLEDALFHQVQHVDAAALPPAGQPHRRDLADGVAALLRETLVNLSRLKANVDQYIRDGEVAPREESSRLLTQISAGFRILQKERIAGLTDHLAQYISSANFTQVRDSRERAERFADAVASIEYYIEAVRDQLPDAEPILDRLSGTVTQLELAQPEAESMMPVEPAAPLPVPVPVQADSIDPEIRDIFVGEAEEVLQTLQDALPTLRRDGQNEVALATVRRAFHTLKGSGRMVGATQIGEFGWSVEKLLNRCLTHELAVDARVLDVVDEAVRLLPSLIGGFRDGRGLDPQALEAVIAHADDLASAQKVEDPQAEIAAVFREDATEKLDAVERWVGEQDPKAASYPVEAEVVRMFHTLRGAGHVAGLPAVSELGMAVETFLDSVRETEARLSPAALQMIREATAALRQWVAEIGTPQVAAQTAAPWLQRIEALQAELPQEAQQKAEARHLAEIFSSEALDLLQKIESTLNAWRHSPDFRQAVGDIRDLSHTLVGAALMSKCVAVAEPARAMNRLMARLVTAPTPAPGFFDDMAQCLEAFFQILDAYREGRLTDDGSGLAARISGLDAPPPVAMPEVGTVATEAIVLEAVDEMPPVATPPATPAPVEDGAQDPELIEIFIGEAEELLQQLDATSAAWETDPADARSAAEVRRLLHTLKGSARVAGCLAIGEVAALMEARVLALDTARPDSQLLAHLHKASDGLHHLVEDLRQGRPLQLASLLQDLAPQAVEAESEVIEMPPVVEAAPEPATDAGVDEEMVRIFSAEAAELLESLDRAYGDWSRDPRDLAGAREMQRALHTLKGGARMAGLPALGNAAHAFETRIDALLAAGEGSPSALAPLGAELEALHHMHDLIERGNSAALRSEQYVPSVLPERVAALVAPDEPAPARVPSLWDPQLFWRPEEEGEGAAAARRETARVPVEQLDSLLNQAGEISIYRSRLDEHNNAIQQQLSEMNQAIARVRDQLRLMDIETEAQIAARGIGHAAQQDRYAGDFDPLEMDRYTRMQELSRALSESVGDLAALHGAMDSLASEAESLLLQQARINTQVQQGLMGTLMVPFSRQVARLQRVVRQTAQENGKQVEIDFAGVESELDRNVLERMTAPLEHLLRNSVIHGIETAARRQSAGKPAVGRVRVALRREGTQLLIELSDDGGGLDYAAIRAQAIRRGLMAPDAQLAEEQIAQFIFEPGFSTAQKLTQDAGRGIGMDVVASEVKQLGGTLELASEAGQGTRFLIRLPLNLAISQALLVEAAHNLFAIPLVSIEGIVRIPREQLDDLCRDDGPLLPYAGHDYRVHYLGDFIGVARPAFEAELKSVSAILVRLGEGLGTQDRRVAVVVDALQGNREIVSKAVGALVSSVTGVSGATILADGRVVLILDVPALALERRRRAALASGRQAVTRTDEGLNNLVMVVDDSVTIRRVTERLLIKQGYRVVTAKDGLDAMAKLQTEQPAAVLLDIEMPRADGFEVAAFIRNNERLSRLPIIMITSRSGDKHRERARQIGVNRYLIKPFQEEDLLLNLRALIEETPA